MISEARVVLEAPPLASNQRHEATTSMAKAYVPHQGPIVTRAQALEQGLSRFFNAIPCKRGHVSERRISDGCCLVCGYEDRVAWKAANRDKVSELERDYRERNNEAINARRRANYPVQKLVMQAYYEANAETIKAQVKARRLAEPDKHRAAREAYYAANAETVKQRVAEHNALHPEKKLARCRNYRARVNGAGRPATRAMTSKALLRGSSVGTASIAASNSAAVTTLIISSRCRKAARTGRATCN